MIVNAALFLAVALWINRLAFFLAPAALLVLVGYSFTKRFTAWCLIVLGVALGIAPVGAYIAVTGEIAVFPRPADRTGHHLVRQVRRDLRPAGRRVRPQSFAALRSRRVSAYGEAS